MQTYTITSGFFPRRSWLLRSAAALLLALGAIIAFPGRAHAGVFVSVGIAPPPLPVYVQPPIPAPGYIWTPGYWAWNGSGYYWVPGAWILPPYVGALWTPGYWGWSGGVYIFHAGYWGRHVGYYGGINYGYGYTGIGYSGGYWRGRGFYYNRSVNHITNRITNVYNRPVARTIVNRTSYNGGPHGVRYSSRANGGLRSAGYAPRTSAAGYRPASRAGYRPAQYRPQSYRAQAYRPAGAARPAYRPAARGQYARPAAHGGGGGREHRDHN